MAEIGLELARQNFVRQNRCSATIVEGSAKRYDGGAAACRLDAWVFWKSDGVDRLTAIRGIHHAGCL